jgi:hypothetical membrane protein
MIKFKSKIFPGSFGAGLIVGPNTINFGTVFQDGAAKLLENIHILVTIVMFLLMFIIMAIIGRKLDKNDNINVSITFSIGSDITHLNKILHKIVCIII